MMIYVFDRFANIVGKGENAVFYCSKKQIMIVATFDLSSDLNLV